MSISTIFKEESTRQRVVNWIGLAQNIVDEYKYGVPHGVQKDALQNGWDAISGSMTKSFVGSNWSFKFELTTLPNGEKVLIMTDSGTTGLTGKMTSKDEYGVESLPQSEKWARWESLAFKKTNKNDLGARGQGKMVFIMASKEYSIFYDSLREDGTYRYGGTIATDRDCKVFHHDEEEGRTKLKEHLGLEPISATGTRVIIINPTDELVATIESGDFLTFIEETWWPIILKYEAKITLKYNGIEKVAQVPEFYPIQDNVKDTDLFKTWITDGKKIKYDGQEYRIKHIRLAYDGNNIKPEIHQGVGCFRGGMKIPTLDFMTLQLRPYVYGYVEFDEDLDAELREIEEPNHYNFSNKGAWRVARLAIEEEMEAFGNKKLGLGVNVKAAEAQKRSDAESAALILLRMLTRGWSFPGHSAGRNPLPPGGQPQEIKEIGLKLHNFEFPNETNIAKLEYDQAIEGFECEAFNNTVDDLKINFRLIVLSGERIIEELENANNVLKGNQRVTYGPYDLKITQTTFPDKGEYKLKLILTNASTKIRIDEITRKFWVATDPPLSAPFDIQALDFSLIDKEDADKLEWILEPEGSGRYKLFYNINHPAYLNYDKETRPLSLYLSELFFQGALELMLQKVSTAGSNEDEQEKIGPFDIKNLQSQNPVELFKEIARVNSKARHLIFRS
jgi:hypothetical protein